MLSNLTYSPFVTPKKAETWVDAGRSKTAGSPYYCAQSEIVFRQVTLQKGACGNVSATMNTTPLSSLRRSGTLSN
jgi:hypothetical protein